MVSCLRDLAEQPGNPQPERQVIKNSSKARSLLTKLLNSCATIPLVVKMARSFVPRSEGLEERPN